MNKVEIRQANLNDLAILLEFEQSIIEYERPFEELMQTEKFNYYDLKELILSDTAEVLVAKYDNQLVGSGYAKIKTSRHYLKDKSHAFLGFMYVSPEHRGKGINKLLIEKLIDWSKTQGMNSVSLTVFSENKSAIKSYKKAGFKKHLVEMRLDIDQPIG